MKSLFTAALLTLISASASAQTCAPVEVRNVRPSQGTLMVAAYTSEADFNKKPMTAMQLAATDEAMSFYVCLPAGSTQVALMMFQDLNGNGKLDANVLGIPTEPRGSSGKPSPYAPPDWAAAAVTLPLPTVASADGKPIVVVLSK